MAVTAKIRHSRQDLQATVYPEENGFARVEFEQPQRAITPGQAVVLYQGDMVVGGGTITDIL
jgi:tRNA-specific 2-thiouridylase